ncbi:protein HsdA [Vibrio diabolicus]|uniref:restriction endonuclease subunit S n=1 Tax=Vibrio diabolicus TaxID=50719 RepID=UPI000CE97885|nr:restriction endonuclease subunit S [Vibrio diabolicus]AVF96453.1 protein HsdA [Vibrio diabolicus]
MSCNWPLKRISEVANFENNKRIPLKSLDREKRQGIYPYYGASGVVDYIDDFIFDGRYLLISEDGENLRTRNTPIAFQASGKFWVNNHAHILSEKEEGILDYLEYYFSVLNIGAYITGAVQPKLNKANLDKIEIPIPPKGERLKLNNVLNSLKYKVALNSETSQTLEEMAQAIFKSWFVDFDPVKAKMNGEQPEGMDAATASLFPEKLVESELGLIPEGWDINYIKDFGKVVTGKTPPKKVEDAYAEEGVPFVTPSDIDSDVFVSETKRFLSESGVEAVKKSLLPEGSICVTCIGSQMGKAVISPSEAVSNQQINSIVVSKDYVRNFLFLNLRRRREEIFLIGSSGSTMPIINKSTFEKLAVLTPSEELMRSFDRSVSSLLSKIHQNAIENQTLSSLRETLLPKLLSGEIELGQAQELAEVE